jgi:MtN3 and saliva related transmembrane protein
MESYLGFLAACCTTIAFIPQAVKVYKSKHTKDISMGMFSLLNIGLVLWLWYGLIIESFPIIISNAITIILALYILITKIRLDVFTSKSTLVNN